MLGGTLVVDAVVHPYNLGPENRIPEGLEQLEAVHAYHRLCTGPHPDFVLSASEFLVDFDAEDLTHAIFAESPVDLAVIHALPNLGFTKGGVTDAHRMAELRDRHPGRYLLYATVDTPVTDAAISQLEAQVEHFEMPADLVEERGFSDLPPETRGKILGGNALRIHGLDTEAVHQRIAGDAFEKAKAAGYGPPWARLRERPAWQGVRECPSEGP